MLPLPLKTPLSHNWLDKNLLDEVEEVIKRKIKLTEYMKQDLETLYLFEGMLLGEWALLPAPLLKFGRTILRTQFDLFLFCVFLHAQQVWAL